MSRLHVYLRAMSSHCLQLSYKGWSSHCLKWNYEWRKTTKTNAQSTQDARVQIRTQIIWCCLRAVWTPPFTSTGPICLRCACASSVDEAKRRPAKKKCFWNVQKCAGPTDCCVSFLSSKGSFVCRELLHISPANCASISADLTRRVWAGRQRDRHESCHFMLFSITLPLPEYFMKLGKLDRKELFWDDFSHLACEKEQT